MMHAGMTLLFISVLAMASRAQGPSPVDNSVVVILMDDIGIEWLGGYADITGIVEQTPDPNDIEPPLGTFPETPGIDEIAAHGVRFDFAWATPLCSPTRAVMNTGSYAFLTGIGKQILPLPGDNSDPTSVFPRDMADPNRQALALGRLAQTQSYGTGCFGKWHMSGSERWGSTPAIAPTAFQTVQNILDPTQFGFDRFYGHLFSVQSVCGWHGYSGKVGVQTIAIDRTMTPTFFLCDLLFDSTNGALSSWVLGQQSPFLCWFAPLAPFELLYRVPNPMESCNNCGFQFHNETGFTAEPGAPVLPIDNARAYHALVESTDAMIQQLLADLDTLVGGNWYDEITIILVGDNGTPDREFVNFYWPATRVKGTTWEGGIRVPFLIAGKAVTRAVPATSPIPVSVADVFPTVEAILGATTSLGKRHGANLVPILQGSSAITRPSPNPGNMVYSETFSPNFAPSIMPPVNIKTNGPTTWTRTASDGTYKVIQDGVGSAGGWTFNSSYLKIETDSTTGGLVETAMDKDIMMHGPLETYMSSLTNVQWPPGN